MADIRIRVGASLDRSTLSAFDSIVGAAKRARAGISQSERQGQQEARAIARQQEQAARQATRAQEREARSAAHAKANAEREAAREIEREATKLARKREQIERDTQRAVVREARRAADEQKRIQHTLTEDQNRIAKERADLRGRVSGGAGRLAYRGAAAAGRAAVGMVGDLARGAGVDLSLGALAAKNVDLGTRATELSNAGYKEGGPRENPNDIVAKVRSVANATAMDASDPMGALQAFVAKTGDLKAGEESLLELAKLSKATGTNLEDMADAAGDVSNNLGDIPNKGEVIAAVMRQIAAQGKTGAVEIKDLSSQMAKVASAANQFEGPAAKSIATFGALAQFTRQKGGSASSTQAATSVQSFANTFSKGARLDAFKKYGVNTEGAAGKVRDPLEIIVDALRATKGDNRAMGDMFKDARARSITKPFEDTFKATYASAKGTEQEKLDAATKAVREEFTKLRDATMSNQELQDSFAAAMATDASQAQLFQNQLQTVTAELQSALYPALKDLSPLFISAATSIADFITQITGKDPRKTALDKKADSINFGAAATTGKALSSGSITQSELDANKEAEKKLEEIAKAKQDAVAKAVEQQNSGPNKAVSGLLKAARFANPLTAIGGDGGASADFERSRQQRIATAQGEAGDAEKHLKDLRDQNKKLSDAVQGGALKVVVVSGGTSPTAPPQTTQ